MMAGWLGQLFSGTAQGQPLNQFMAEQAIVALSQEPAASAHACRVPTFGKGRALSPLGSLLTLSDYLSKIRILAEHARVDEADPALFDGLPPHALRCCRALDPDRHSGSAAGALLAR